MQKKCRHICILRFDGSLFFANAAYLETKITNILANKKQNIKYIIFDVQGINYVDSSGVESLNHFFTSLNEVGVEMLFVRMKEDTYEIIKRTDLAKKIKHNLFESRTAAIQHVYKKAHENSDEEHCPLNLQ